MVQLCVYMYLSFFKFFSHLSCYKNEQGFLCYKCRQLPTTFKRKVYKLVKRLERPLLTATCCFRHSPRGSQTRPDRPGAAPASLITGLKAPQAGDTQSAPARTPGAVPETKVLRPPRDGSQEPQARSPLRTSVPPGVPGSFPNQTWICPQQSQAAAQFVEREAQRLPRVPGEESGQLVLRRPGLPGGFQGQAFRDRVGAGVGGVVSSQTLF